MYTLILFCLFSLYTIHLLKYKNLVLKKEHSIYKASVIKNNFIYKEKSATVTKVKLLGKIKKQYTKALFWNFGISTALLLWR